MMVTPITNCYSQSAAAFEKAGDHSMEQHDPFTAITFYNQGLDYNETASLCFKLGEAYNELHEYENALKWYLSASIKSENDDQLYNNSILKSADLLKCLGRFQDAKNQLLRSKNLITIDSIRFKNTLHGIDFAEQLMKDTLPISVNLIGDEINSSYSDFGPSPSGDSVLYFSSMRFFRKNKTETQKLTSKILVSKISNNQFSIPEPLPSSINSATYNNANPSISPDHQIMIFTHCLEDENNNLICTLLESQYQKGQWQTPKVLNDSINFKKYTSTQPCITTNGNDGYLIFYSSNRPNGFGKNDIWIVKRNPKGDYSNPINAGSIINSKDNEMTPFYDAMTDTLYFSSDREEGLGGFDLLATSFVNKSPQNTIHPGPPFNSGYNDLYYSANYSNPRTQYLVSNRPPAEQLNGGACCYDLFSIKNLIPIKKDSVITPLEVIPLTSLPLSQIPLDSITNLPLSITLKKLSELLPLRLYFDNDFPDPHTRKTSTISLFNILITSYLQKLPEYLNAHKNDSLQKKELRLFFKDSIEANFQKLETFTAVITKLLQSGNSLKLMLQGCASPLADNAYNVTLSSRRISSLRNYWMQWNHGEIKEFIQSGQLILNEDPAGEHLAAAKVSDKLNNKSESVYSVSAALERRIEVTEISLQKP